MQSSWRAGSWDAWAWEKAGAGGRIQEREWDWQGIPVWAGIPWSMEGLGMVNSRIALPPIRGEKRKGVSRWWQAGGTEWRAATRAESVCVLAQNAMVSVKELCGLPPIASLKQCILTLSSRLVSSDNAPSVALCMKDTFPYLEPLGTVPDVQKKVLAAYDLVSASALLPLPFPTVVMRLCPWLSHAQMFQLNKQGSSNDSGSASWPSVTTVPHWAFCFCFLF